MNVFSWIGDWFHWLGLLALSAVLDLEDYLRPRAEAELRRLRNAAAMAVGFPLLLIIVGSVLGLAGDGYKRWFIGVGLLILLVQLLVLAWRRAVAGIVLGTLFEAAVRGATGFGQVIVGGAEGYIRVVVYLMFTEIAIGIFAIAFPVHENFSAALLALIAGLGLAAYGIWSRRPDVWPGVVRRVLLFALLAALLSVLFPAIGDRVWSLRNGMNSAIQSGTFSMGTERTLTDPTATEIRGVHRITVSLRGPNQWIDISDRLPGCTRTVHKTYLAQNPRIRSGRGAPQPLIDGSEYGRTKYPIEVDGDGKIIFELFELGKHCT